MPNTLDELMSLDPLDLSAQNIDEIIAYQRKARAAWDSGIKPKKGDHPAISLEKLGLVPKGPTIKRRKLT